MEVKAVLLDVNGTLFPVTAAAPAFQALGLSPEQVEPWFAGVLRDAFAAQLAGVFAPFSDFAAHGLRRLLSAAGRGDVDPTEAAARVTKAWAAADPFPDVGPGLVALRDCGLTVAALTNGSVQLAAQVLRRAGVAPEQNAEGGGKLALFDINEALAWKPSREAYMFAVNALLLAPEEVVLAAAHPWDCHGALQAGLRAAYVRRPGSEPYPSFLDRPQYEVASFEELAAVLAGGR